ncbi:hypothetical protein M407DRAFT_242975 [Tulasnella calospora MUT 4182]|uniref:Ribosomal protein S8 n=1 Tax=Tulasnella calospora MUT 4182 TaxID=1051891 RepID=A0A0C3L407_9AGAM|nr:hypothetical protein M407DRAFT_242975 [Tulasnella calospora MUT 4182]
MILPYDLMARLQNGFMARLKRLPVPHTTQNLAIASIMLRHGFLSNVTRGTVNSADPDEWHAAPEPHRRIWVDLKYRDDLPVLSKAEVISKPSKRVVLTPEDVRRICSGQMASFVKPLGMGEVAVIREGGGSKIQWYEAREALEKGVGGEILCRMR